jgi:hypothetical protein
MRAVVAVEGDGGNDGGVGAFEPGLECRLVGCESSEQSRLPPAELPAAKITVVSAP